VNVDLSAHLIRDDGFGGRGSIVGVENLGGSYLDDTLRGDAGDNILSGLDGNDYLVGGAGNDTLIGGAGDDYLRGGSGVDSFDGGDGVDRVSFNEADATQGVVVDLRTQTVENDGFGNTEHMSSIEAIGAGTRFADTFYGNDGDNLILVGGNDTAYGFGGTDTFQVDDAPAVIDGGAGVDTISMFTLSRLVDADGDGVAEYQYSATGVNVDLSAHAVYDDGFGGTGTIVNVENLGGSYSNDRLVGDAGANVLSGLDGDDDLFGGAGSDTLQGGAGDDWLFGEAGNDRLTGGDGADMFVFGPGSQRDTVTDFQSGVDHIWIDGVADFSQLAISHNSAGDVVINLGTGFDLVTLTGVHDVTAADFIFGG
jgi:Ca2+-binding RTX toxin-like protein